MLIQICDNLIVNTDRIDYVHDNVLVMTSGETFKLNDIGKRNIQKVSDAMQADLFSKMYVEFEP